MRLTYIIFIIFLILCFQACEKIANETDPAKIVVGKWRLVEMGNWPVMNPVQDDGYMEFFPDSTKIEHGKDPGDITNKIYWIDSLLLQECIYSKTEDKCILTFKFKYQFYNKNHSMRLDVTNPSLYTTTIFKRIK
jgi:hypothetical protein